LKRGQRKYKLFKAESTQHSYTKSTLFLTFTFSSTPVQSASFNPRLTSVQLI